MGSARNAGRWWPCRSDGRREKLEVTPQTGVCGPNHGRTKAREPMADKKTAGPQASVLPVKGEATTALGEPLRVFWSRRRQSTSVNGVCQAKTTTSSISCGKGGIKDHNSRISLVENAGKPHPARVCGLSGKRRRLRGTMRPCLIRAWWMCHSTRLRAGCRGHKAWKWCNFGGWLWEGWKTVSQGHGAGVGCANVVKGGGGFDGVKTADCR